MADLVRGKYPITHPFSKLWGTFNASQSDLAVRSNAEWFGLSGISDGALAATGVAAAVPVPVEPGDTFTKLRLFVGAAAEATGTHAYVALYSGIAVPALLSQSVDATGATAVGPVNAPFDFTLPSTTITQAQAPNGYIYASIAITATTVPTVMAVGTPTAVGYQLFTNAPLFFSATHGSGLVGVAPATIASPAAKAVAPIVALY